MYFAIYKVWEQKCNCVLLFTECESENANVFCHLQSVGAQTDGQFAIYRVWEPKQTVDLLFTGCGSLNEWSVLLFTECGRVNRKLVRLFTKCGSENRSAISSAVGMV